MCQMLYQCYNELSPLLPTVSLHTTPQTADFASLVIIKRSTFCYASNTTFLETTNLNIAFITFLVMNVDAEIITFFTLFYSSVFFMKILFFPFTYSIFFRSFLCKNRQAKRKMTPINVTVYYFLRSQF